MNDVFREFAESGGTPRVSDAITINGQPGDLYPCSESGTVSTFLFIFRLATE